MLLMQSAAVTSQSTTRDYGQDSQWNNGFGAGVFSQIKGAYMREWVETVVRVIHRQDVKPHFVEASTKHGCTRTQLNN